MSPTQPDTPNTGKPDIRHPEAPWDREATRSDAMWAGLIGAAILLAGIAMLVVTAVLVVRLVQWAA